MYDPFHGNVDIVLADDTKMKASSLLLSWNSATFRYLFTDLRMSTVEMKDFSKGAVIAYLECLYSGDIIMDKPMFREMNKLSYAFKTEWLSDHCKAYFVSLCEENVIEFEELKFLFDEAVYVKNVLKSSDFIEIVVNCFIKTENIGELFVERYIKENYCLTATEILESLLVICQGELLPVIKVMKEHLVTVDIDDTTRYLLSNNQVVKYFASHSDLYAVIYELLALKATNNDYLRFITNLNVSVLKYAKETRENDKKQEDMIRNFPNLYHDKRVLQELSDEELIVALNSMPNISIFLLVELVYVFLRVKLHSKASKIKDKLLQMCLSKSLCRIPTIFVAQFHRPDLLKELPHAVISDDDSVIAISTETTATHLFTTPAYYKLFFKQPVF